MAGGDYSTLQELHPVVRTSCGQMFACTHVHLAYRPLSDPEITRADWCGEVVEEPLSLASARDTRRDFFASDKRLLV